MRAHRHIALWLAVTLGLAGTSSSRAETLRIPAVADVWLSDANSEERRSSAGASDVFKLKTIQELALVRFDPELLARARGREIVAARIWLHPRGEHMLRFLRMSTVNRDWIEGGGRSHYGPGNGASWESPDQGRPGPAGTPPTWAGTGSAVCDVIMGAGHSRVDYAQLEPAADGWLTATVPTPLAQSLVGEDSDGLALLEGGSLAWFNNFVHSAQSGAHAPVLELVLGAAATDAPAAPRFRATAAPASAGLDTGALRIEIEDQPRALAWRVRLDDEPVPRWQLPHPVAGSRTSFVLRELPPETEHEISIRVISSAGILSPASRVRASSSARRPAPPGLPPPSLPSPRAARPPQGSVWALPGLVKLSPVDGRPLNDELADDEAPDRVNAVWDGTQVQLSAARGEIVSFQICVERPRDANATAGGFHVDISPFATRGDDRISTENVEVFRCWYARNRSESWQPAYLIPLDAREWVAFPDPAQGIEDQDNQLVYVDIFVPRATAPGRYEARALVERDSGEASALPVILDVHPFALPDTLGFWPELNAYRVPEHHLDYHRLAHQNRCVFNPWVYEPKLQGEGGRTVVDWEDYDARVGPLLSGAAFEQNRRAGVPVACLYLPFYDSWPVALDPQTYDYPGYWPQRGDSKEHLIRHSMEAPLIEQGLSADYRAGFLSVQRQFVEHFEERGYRSTEMQCFYGSKASHRLHYRRNVWWTTDEPYHFEDWRALDFFAREWQNGRARLTPRADEGWPFRADISRPEWQAGAVPGGIDLVYYGSFDDPATARRARTETTRNGGRMHVYGSANADDRSNLETVSWMLYAYGEGARGVMPWQSLGSEKALEQNDRGAFDGNALLVPGTRFGEAVVADIRIRALRDGQQLTEYLDLLARRRGLSREQLRALVRESFDPSPRESRHGAREDADAGRYPRLEAWQLEDLRRALAQLLIDP